MNIMKARIVWFPELLTYIDYDYLEDSVSWDQEQDHLANVRKYLKEDGLLFPAIIAFNHNHDKYEIHGGHFRFKAAKELGYDGLEAYKVSHPRDVLYLTEFNQMCYKHYLELKKIKENHRPNIKFI
jgi:hypothetical protein